MDPVGLIPDAFLKTNAPEIYFQKHFYSTLEAIV
jgi:hypothetical protein